ncbi:MAG: acyl-CoA thioesterase [Phycisphaeraceae bacterium]|nr:acyl-CoA thioesterase [Phycisphaeraceae bacterium]
MKTPAHPDPAATDAGSTPIRGRTQVRVRYGECDPMGVAHHSVYAVWLELARTELLRQAGHCYADMERQGDYFVVAELSIRFRRSARYDDLLTVHVWVSKCTRAKLVHSYEIRRGEELLVTGQTTLACVDHKGRLKPVPADIVALGGGESVEA